MFFKNKIQVKIKVMTDAKIKRKWYHIKNHAVNILQTLSKTFVQENTHSTKIKVFILSQSVVPQSVLISCVAIEVYL